MENLKRTILGIMLVPLRVKAFFGHIFTLYQDAREMSRIRKEVSDMSYHAKEITKYKDSIPKLLFLTTGKLTQDFENTENFILS